MPTRLAEAGSAAPVVVVVGSANRDLIVSVSHIARPGETVLATASQTQPGGKGANQAVAAARAGARVWFVGAVGRDDAGATVRAALAAEAIHLSHLTSVADAPTGCALISVAADGENAITVLPGANASLDPAEVTTAIETLAIETLAIDHPVVVTQAEVSDEAVVAAMAASSRLGCRFIHNLAPPRLVTHQVLRACDPLVVNQTEASAVVGFAVDSPESVADALDVLAERCASVVVTLGAEGARWAQAGRRGHVPVPEPVTVVDTIGAGDAFVGTLAASLAGGHRFEDAVAAGVIAGTRAVQARGAQARAGA